MKTKKNASKKITYKTASKVSTITQTQILDAAEQLFAEKGISATSIRSIVQLANVNLAAVYYHFGSKEDLLLAALRRVSKPVIKAQIQNLIVIEENEGTPLIEELFRAFFLPVLELTSSQIDKRGRIKMKFLGRCCSDSTTEHITAQEFELSHQLFLQVFQQALPNCPKEEIQWKLELAIAMLVSILYTSHQPSVSHQNTYLKNSEITIHKLVRFVTAGMKS